MSEGWKCPVCGHGNAPWVQQCPCADVHLAPTTWPPYTYPPDYTGDPLPSPSWTITCSVASESDTQYIDLTHLPWPDEVHIY